MLLEPLPGINKTEAFALNPIKIEEKQADAQQLAQIQPAWQRPCHNSLQDTTLVKQFLTKLDQSLDLLRKNWDSHNAVGLFATVGARLLTVGPEDTQQQSLEFLVQCQRVCFDWLHVLRTKAAAAASDADRARFQLKSRAVALSGITAFSVDQCHLKLLLEEEEKREMLLAFSITAQETEIQASDDVLIKTLAWRWRRIMRRAYRIFRSHVIREQSSCLSKAIRGGWQSFDSENVGGWSEVAENSPWLMTKTSYSTLHFNLLTTELLVNGAPVSRLPAEYESSKSYGLLFGQERVEVLASNDPAMKFVARSEYDKHKVHFGPFKSTHLPVRAWLGEVSYDLIPANVFRDELPPKFIKEFVHWYDGVKQCVEFRRKDQPWTPVASGWKLVKNVNFWQLQRDSNLFLVGSNTATTDHFAQIFAPLEKTGGLHLIWNAQARVLNIEIPRLRLNFSVDEGSELIMSHEYKGMHVDMNQNIDCLMGLYSKLVLQNTTGIRTRRVLIPADTVHWEPWQLGEGSHDHVKVTVDYEASMHYAYVLDPYIGKLTSNGGIESNLFLAYLHALTSYPLYDLFTGRTGTEEALTILRSAGVRSFNTLTEENIKILKLLSGLSPQRRTNSKDHRTMQVVTWDPSLDFLAQHGGFAQEVQEIVEQAKRTQFFDESVKDMPQMSSSDHHFLERDRIRSSTFYAEGFSAELFRKDEDVKYEGRGCNQSSDPCQRVFEIAVSILEKRGTMPRRCPNKDEWRDRLHSVLSAGKVEYCKDEATSEINDRIQYQASWLKPMEEILPSIFSDIHHIFLEDVATKNMFQKAAWLAGIAFVLEGDDPIVGFLLAITSFEAFASMKRPPTAEYHLKHGREVDPDTVSDIIEQWLLPPPVSPEQEGHVKQEHAVPEDCPSSEFRYNQDRCAKYLHTEIKSQWPSDTIKPPQDWTAKPVSKYINVKGAMTEIRRNWKSWSNNRKFFDYLGRLCAKQKEIPVKEIVLSAYTNELPPWVPRDTRRYVGFNDLFTMVSAPELPPPPTTEQLTSLVHPGDILMHSKLEPIVRKLAVTAQSPYERSYAEKLKRAKDHLESRPMTYELRVDDVELYRLLDSYRHDAKSYFEQVLTQFQTISTSTTQIEDSLFCQDAAGWQTI